MATWVTDTPFILVFLEHLKKRTAYYWRHGNNPLPEKMKYNTKFCNDSTIQHFMWGESSEFKLENNKVPGSDGLHIRNQVTLNDEKLVCLSNQMWIKSLGCRLPHIYI